MHKIWEIAFQYTHTSSFVIGDGMGGQLAWVTTIDRTEIWLLIAGIGVPAIDLGFTFVTEEYGRTIIRTNNDLFIGFNTDIYGQENNREICLIFKWQYA